MVAQDLPPPNGFGSIKIERVLPKPIIRQGILLLAGVALSINGLFYAGEWRKRYRVIRIEQMEHYIAAIPFLFAERERKYLIQLRKIRDKERELMKDVPGWVVGTLFGEPIYKTLPKNTLAACSVEEFCPGIRQHEWIDNYVYPDLWE